MPTPTSTSTAYDVVICSYNGADYIAEQLHSILQQTPAPAGVWISDDGSTDETGAIVKQIAQTSETPIHFIQGPGQGIIANMLAALPQTQAPYVFLADQDDIWLDNKAALFCEQMHNSDKPHLIFSDAWVWHPATDEKHSFWESDRLNPANAQSTERLAFHNTVQGASACVNRALIEATTHDARIVMHDWWLALIASGLGHVSVIHEPTLLYRQHDNNQIGSQNQAGQHKRSLSHRCTVATRILRQAQAFAQHYGHQLAPKKHKFFSAYHKALAGNIFQRTWFISRYWPQHRDLLHTITLWVFLLARGLAESIANSSQEKKL